MEEELQFEEQEPEKKKIKGLPSTIVSGVFLLVSIICLIIGYLINLTDAINELFAQVDSVGSAIGAIFVSIFVVLFVSLTIILLIAVPLGFSIPVFILSIKNSKSEIKPIKVLAIIFLILSIIIFLVAIGRIVLLAAFHY